MEITNNSKAGFELVPIHSDELGNLGQRLEKELSGRRPIVVCPAGLKSTTFVEGVLNKKI